MSLFNTMVSVGDQAASSRPDVMATGIAQNILKKQ